jgi:hypothetical protein
MSGEVFDDITKIFEQLGIKTSDAGSCEKSVYKLSGVYSCRKKYVTVTIVHYYWEHFSKISISNLELPKEKIGTAYELANLINCSLKYDHFKIDPESGAVQLYAGFYSGVVSNDEEEADDDSEFSDGMDGYSYEHLRMLISQMVTRFYMFSPLFEELIDTTKTPCTIYYKFRDNLTQEERKSLDEFID